MPIVIGSLVVGSEWVGTKKLALVLRRVLEMRQGNIPTSSAHNGNQFFLGNGQGVRLGTLCHAHDPDVIEMWGDVGLVQQASGEGGRQPGRGQGLTTLQACPIKDCSWRGRDSLSSPATVSISINVMETGAFVCGQKSKMVKYS